MKKYSIVFFLISLFTVQPVFASGSPSQKGVNWHAGAWYNTPLAPNSYYFSGIDSDFMHMQEADIHWIRSSFNLRTQSTCGTTTFYTKLINLAKSHNLNILGTLSIPNATTTTATSSERSTYTSWLSTIVQCYKNDVHVWEIHNEPNLHFFWNISESTTDNSAYSQSVTYYLQYLHDAYTTIKAIDPTATVVFAGLSQHTWKRFMDVVILQHPESANYFDAFAFHPYSDTGPTGVATLIDSLKSELQSNSAFASKPIWITEVGYTATATEYPGNTGGSETLKASYLSQTYQILADKGITTPIFWFDYAQDSSLGSAGYELEYTDRSNLTSIYRPAYTNMKSLWPSSSSTLLGDLDADRKVTVYDYSVLLQNFGRTGSPGFISADIIQNGIVDLDDYRALTANFGKQL
jgi:hypothetical protein